MSGFVYIIENEAGLFKIGYSADPKKRLSQLSTSSAGKLTLRAMFAGTMEDEKETHEALAPWRVMGEWFRDCLSVRALIATAPVVTPQAHVAAPLARIPVDQVLASLISRIDAYLASTGISESNFGRDAVNDDRFVSRLRASGNCTFKTYRRVDEWLWAREAVAPVEAEAAA